MLLRIADTEHLDVARQLLHAQEYLRMKQFAFDLVILNECSSSYVRTFRSGSKCWRGGADLCRSSARKDLLAGSSY